MLAVALFVNHFTSRNKNIFNRTFNCYGAIIILSFNTKIHATSFPHSFIFCEPFVCFYRENSPYVVKFNLQSNKLEAQIHLSGLTQRRNGYRWCGGYCAVDLAVDEQGLWALWGDSDNSRRLYAQKIDVFKNVVIDTYTLSTGELNQILQ